MNEETLFIEALEVRDPAERAAFLGQACAATRPSAAAWSACSNGTGGPAASSTARPLASR